jgi:hypothetical protein
MWRGKTKFRDCPKYKTSGRGPSTDIPKGSLTMSDLKEGEKSVAQGFKTCPECNGNKTIAGVCTCDMEWRGTQAGEILEDCQCTPDTSCPLCKGKGLIKN